MAPRQAPARVIRPLPAWLALLVSLCVHATLLVGAWLSGGSLLAGGEDGWIGAGGETLEITMQGWDATRAPEAPDEAEAEAAAAPAAPEETPLTTEEPAAPPIELPRNRRPAPQRATAAATGSAAETPQRGQTGDDRPEGEVTVAARPGQDEERTGRAAGDEVAAVILGSVGLGGRSSRTRSLLEGALTCPDPVAGVWTSHRYSPARRNWGRMTLRIRREGDELSGTITSRIWSGMPSDRRPLPCAPGRYDVTVRMPARGRVEGDRFSFGASSYEVARVDCPWQDTLYYPDRFSGRVDSAREELDAVNNDGAVEFNAPYTFRRVSCE